MEGVITSTKVEGDAVGCWDYKKAVAKILQENSIQSGLDGIKEEGRTLEMSD